MLSNFSTLTGNRLDSIRVSLLYYFTLDFGVLFHPPPHRGSHVAQAGYIQIRHVV